jgi:hypothetical protein
VPEKLAELSSWSVPVSPAKVTVPANAELISTLPPPGTVVELFVVPAEACATDDEPVAVHKKSSA